LFKFGERRPRPRSFFNRLTTKKMEQKRGNYAVIPAVVLHDKNLTFFARILFAEISAQINQVNCYATDAEFAEILGCSKNTVSKALKSLEEAGYISITSHGRRGRVICRTPEAFANKYANQ
jgi:biotin operon repressor